jgi:hypothetical protein
MVIMAVLLSSKIIETVEGLGYERFVAHDGERAGAVPKRSDPGDKSFNWLIYRLIKRSRVGRRTDADLAGVRGVLGLGQRGWVESLLDANAGTWEMKRCYKRPW